jgi:hypothetical protein
VVPAPAKEVEQEPKTEIVKSDVDLSALADAVAMHVETHASPATHPARSERFPEQGRRSGMSRAYLEIVSLPEARFPAWIPGHLHPDFCGTRTARAWKIGEASAPVRKENPDSWRRVSVRLLHILSMMRHCIQKELGQEFAYVWFDRYLIVSSNLEGAAQIAKHLGY